ncbi:MAG: TonB-dependent receptor [Gemmatimonadaceae bacterium]
MWILGLLALVASARDALAQGTAGRITGVITATEGGQPISDVHVTVPSTRLGAVTGADGRYTINAVPVGTYSVRAQRIGFTPMVVQGVVVAADGLITVDFQLKKQTVELEQVVVVGYGTQRRRDVTGSVSTVSGEEIQQSPTNNAIDAIKGKVPGVEVTAAGYAPGAEVNVLIRGRRSIRASNEPLYVLDGIPMAGGIGDLSPGDIESIDVLKDASATAIYGSRGANGVVLITSRQGRRGATRITYDTYAGTQKIYRKIDLMNGVEFAEYKRESRRAVNKYTTDAALFYPVEISSLQAGLSTDWQDQVLRTGAQMSHQIGITGGNEKTRISVSANQINQQGITRSQDFDRRSMRLNADHQASDRLRIGASALILRSVRQLGSGGVWDQTLRNNPLGIPRDASGNVIFKPTPDGLAVSPISEYLNASEERMRTRLFSTLFAEYDIAEGLNLRTNFGPDLIFNRFGRFRGSETDARQGGAPDAFLDENRTYAYTLDNILRYRAEFRSAHRLDATLLYSVQRERNEYQYTSVSGLPYDRQLFYDLGSAGTIEGVGSSLTRSALQSFMGRVNYEWRDKYLLTLTGRLDGSSRLADGHKYAFFPSVALGWRLNDEPFFRNTGLFSELKLRGSYGQTGNAAIDPYQTLGGLSRTTYSFGDKPAYGYRPNSLPNPDLRWEKTEQFDAGLEFATASQRVSGTVDAYLARTSDLLLLRQLPPTTGYSSILQNIGKTRNVGFEFSVTTVNVPGGTPGALRWTSTFNYAMNRNRIVDLYGDNKDDVGNRWFIGQPINVFYDLEFAGIWQTADAALAAAYKRKPGEIRVTDRTGPLPCPPPAAPGSLCRSVSDKDRKVLGTPEPRWTGSMSNRIDWKGLDLSVYVLTRQGSMLYSNFHTNFSTLAGRYNNLRVDYWTPTNPSNTNPRPNVDQEFPQDGSARAYKDASFVRIRNITLGYTLPTRYSSRTGAQSLRLYAAAENPFISTSYDGFDPEAGNNAAAPSYRALLAGLGLVF